MKFSTRSEYGLRVMVKLAKNYQNTAAQSLPEIAREEGLSLPYLERLAAKLRQSGLIMSIKGVNGGYQLSRAPAAISIADIIEVLEGDLFPSKCIPKVKNRICHKKECLSRQVWFQLYGAIKTTLEGMKLSDLIGK